MKFIKSLKKTNQEEKTQVINIRNENMNVTTDTIDIKMIIKRYNE